MGLSKLQLISIVAVATLGTTFWTARTADAGWWAISGPLALAAGMIGAAAYAYRRGLGNRRGAIAAGIQACGLLVACLIVFWVDPQDLPLLVGILVPTMILPILNGFEADDSRCCGWTGMRRRLFQRP